VRIDAPLLTAFRCGPSDMPKTFGRQGL